ncbi:hypothetical protein GGE12_005763 [Rhizobium mongolense]|uniref:Uncharacterized protein n=1 Tax=Rhizobium mongolense TaxID=57676 RepID=A0A7W6WHL4_9HYPH|nr:hypothetical protein [Rhizobium mongolense]
MFEALSSLLGNRPVVVTSVIIVACLVLIIAPLALVGTRFADANVVVDKLREENFALQPAPRAIATGLLLAARLHSRLVRRAEPRCEECTEILRPIGLAESAVNGPAEVLV